MGPGVLPEGPTYYNGNKHSLCSPRDGDRDRASDAAKKPTGQHLPLTWNERLNFLILLISGEFSIDRACVFGFRQFLFPSKTPFNFSFPRSEAILAGFKNVLGSSRKHSALCGIRGSGARLLHPVITLEQVH